MKTVIRPAIIALALLSTVAAASAAPRHYQADGAVDHETLADDLNFWAQFSS